MTTTWYVRKTGFSTNGGTSASIRSNANDGATTNGTNTFTSASASWSAADIGHAIYINSGVASPKRRLITAVGSPTSLTFGGAAATSTTSSITWVVGGAMNSFTTALGSDSTTIADGDTVWVGGGTYRETVTAGFGGSSSAITFQGDVDGKNTGDVGDVQLTAFTTNDTTTYASAAVLNINGKNWLTFNKITFVGGNQATASVIRESVGGAHDITFAGCTFINPHASAATIAPTQSGANALNWTINGCIFLCCGNSGQISITGADPNQASDVDLNFIVQNCLFMGGGQAVVIVAPAAHASSGYPAGVRMNNCIVISSAGMRVSGANWSTTTPAGCYNNVIISTATVLQATTSGSLVENYNMLQGATIRTNVTAGANSQIVTAYAPLFEIGQAMAVGRAIRPWMMPMNGSPALGFGNSGAFTAPTVDAWNRSRPAGGGSTSNGIGYLERHDTGVQDTSTYNDTISSLKIGAGPGTHRLQVPVNANSTTLSIKVNRDSNYGGGTAPTVKLLANGLIGVSSQSVTDGGSASAWNTITLSAITPTAAGIVTIELDCTGSAATGKTYWDTAGIPSLTNNNGTAGFNYFNYAGEPADVLAPDPGPFPVVSGGAIFEEELVL